MIWDRGPYRYDGDDPDPMEGLRRGYLKGELKMALQGKRLKGSWVLVRTKRRQGKRPQWLLIKRRDDEARPGSDIAAERPESVVSGRTLDDL